MNFNSKNVPNCANFDIDLKANDVKCIQRGFGQFDDLNSLFDKEQGRRGMMVPGRKSKSMKNPATPIRNLGQYFGSSGIP